MAKMHSNMLPLGTIAPDFDLLDTNSGQQITLSNFKSGNALVIMFLCNHCPYVKHIQAKIVELSKKYQPLGVNFVAISSNNVDSHPQDGPDHMHEEAVANGYTFPYLYDATQEIAHKYQAACTPDFYIFNKDLACVYRGRFDESTPGNDKPVTGIDITNALDCLLTGKPISTDQTPSVGCGIKWK